MNPDALTTILAAPTRLLGYRPAAEVVAGVGKRRYLHSGPPIDFDRGLPMPLVGGLIAGLLFEGEADDPNEALRIVQAGELDLSPCQDTNVAGPLAGIVTPRTPMTVLERSDGVRFCAPMHEGDVGGMRTGMFDPDSLDRLARIADVTAPALDQAVAVSDPIHPELLAASALRRGDECHNRNVSATLALLLAVSPGIGRLSSAEATAVLDYFTQTTQHFICLSAALARSIADRIDHEPALAGLVTAVGMNGQDFGIRVGGLDGWFRAPSPRGPMVPLEGADISRASAGQGDSPIIETIGLGAFSLSSAPALGRTLGYTGERSLALVEEMRRIAAGASPVFELANQDFAPSPAGIDIRKVVATGIPPATTLGFLSRDLGAGRVGAGVIRMPLEPFTAAATALGEASL